LLGFLFPDDIIIVYMMVDFPKHFLWGAATSAYQVEGNNVNSDWWQWEIKAGLKEVSGQACRHYELYKEDFDLAKLLHHNAHRFSIEWSRIEPQEGKFSGEEIGHYYDVVCALRERNIEPIVTLHHFTNPHWLAGLGGWANRDAAVYFLRYVELLVRELSDKVRYWVTINEPMVYAYESYILGTWPPQEKSFLKASRVISNLLAAHINAYRVIHSIYKKKNLISPYVGVASNMLAFVPCRMILRDKLAAYLRNRFFNFSFIEKALRNNSLDFIGVNYYTRNLVEVEKWRLKNLLLDVCVKNHHPLKKNSMGWDIYPEGLYQLLLSLKKYNMPVLILENGICTDDDNLRWDFISQHLSNINLAMQKGVNIAGYIYWSLIDNFEWDKGFKMRFGLIAVDYHTYKRTPRESAKKLSLVFKTGRID